MDDEQLGQRLASTLRARATTPVSPDRDGLELAFARRRHQRRTRRAVGAAATLVVCALAAGGAVVATRHQRGQVVSTSDHGPAATTGPGGGATTTTARGSAGGPPCEFNGLGDSGTTPTYCGQAMRRLGEREVDGAPLVVWGLTCAQLSSLGRPSACGTLPGVVGVVATSSTVPNVGFGGSVVAPTTGKLVVSGGGGGDVGDNWVLVALSNSGVARFSGTNAQGHSDSAPALSLGATKLGVLHLPFDPNGAGVKPLGAPWPGAMGQMVTEPATITALDARGVVIRSESTTIQGVRMTGRTPATNGPTG